MAIWDYDLKFGINLSMIFTEVPLLQRFALARQAGFNTVEIQFPYELSIAQIQQQLQQHQLNLCLINVPAGDLMQGGLGLACVPERMVDYRQAVEQAVEYAKKLNVPTINVLAGRQSLDATAEQCWDTLKSNLAYTAEYAKQYDIQVVFELINPMDMPNFFLYSLAQAEQMLAEVGDENLAIQYDCYHLAKMGQDVLGSLKQFLPKIKHIQFADYPHRHEPNTGNLNFSDIFQYLEQSGYQGYVCAEYKPSGHSQHTLAWIDTL